MRVPPTQERRPFRVRGWMIAVVVVLLVLLFSLRGLAGFYTDYLWFDSLGQGSTWGSLLAARVVPALVFTIFFFAIMFANLLIADRFAPRTRGLGAQTPEDELVARYQQTTARYHGRIRVGVAAFFALIAGIGVSSQWREWILFTHRVDFGRTDPQFHRDIGFYVFSLPFIKFIVDWLFAGLVIVLLVTAVAHFLNGGIRFQNPLQRATPAVKVHLSVILAVMALVKTTDYYFGRYELPFSQRGVVDGALYTDVKAQLPALELLVFVSVIAAALFIWNIYRRGWVLPMIAVGLWAFISLVVGTIYPAAVQNFKVKPNEFANEAKYIQRNINATRQAFGLSSVSVNNFDASDLPASAVNTNLTTINNAPVGPEHHPVGVPDSPGLPDLLRHQRRRCGSVHRQRPDHAGDHLGPRPAQQQPPEPVVGQRASRLHARLRRGGVPEQPDRLGRQPRVPLEGHPDEGSWRRAERTGRAGVLRGRPQWLRDRERQAG